jgi:hypothetical protein
VPPFGEYLMSSVEIASFPLFSMVKSSEKGSFTVAKEGHPERFKFMYQLFAIAAVAVSASNNRRVVNRFINSVF